MPDEYVIVNKSDLTSMADTVRSTTGSTEKISVNNLNDAVATAVTSGGVLIDSSLTQSGYAADAKATGDALRSLSEEIANLQTSGLTTAKINALNGLFKIGAYTEDASAAYAAFKTAFGISDSEGGETEKTLTGISATYTGGDVPAGTALDDLTDIIVTAQYSDGSTASVTGYTMSGEINEGSNTITVSYGGMTTTFSVTGVAESSVNPFAGTWTEGFRLQSSGKEYATGHATYDTTDYVDCTNFNTVTISATLVGTNQIINAVVWYDDSKTYISGEGQYYINLSNNTDYPPSRSFTKPDGAAYCRICLVGYENFNISVE